jgi:hypothetical protein
VAFGAAGSCGARGKSDLVGGAAGGGLVAFGAAASRGARDKCDLDGDLGLVGVRSWP